MPGARLTEAYICGDNGVIDSTDHTTQFQVKQSVNNGRSVRGGEILVIMQAGN